MEKKKNYSVLFFIALLALAIFYIWQLVNKTGNAEKKNFIFFIVLSHLFTIFLFWAIVHLLKICGMSFSSSAEKKRGLTDFIIGDEGGYSLSRLQAVLWAVTIISYIICILMSLYLQVRIPGSRSPLFTFEPALSESVVWLLGLSLTSVISVKGITVEKMKNDPARMMRKANRVPRPIDIITGENGLDFSKCQMLIWTMIAILVFNAKVYEFSYSVYEAKDKDKQALLFQNYYEEYASKKQEEKKKIDDADIPYVPYLPWAFVVLMGLSQGAYVGKKLVPNFKLDEVRAITESELQKQLQELETKKQLLNQLISNAQKNKPTELDIKNIQRLQQEVQSIQTRIDELKKDKRDIENFKM